MPQTRDTAPQEPAANGGAPPVTEKRVDAAHSIGDAVSAPLLADLSLAELPLCDVPIADIPLAEIAVEQAISELVRAEGTVPLRAQADQLGAHLRERQRQLDHRESEVNARLAAFEQEVREARAWLAQKNDELNDREARLEALETAIKNREVASPAPSRPGFPRAAPAGPQRPAATSPPDAADESGLHKPMKPTAGPIPSADPALPRGPVSAIRPLSFAGPACLHEPFSFQEPAGDTQWEERKRALSRVSQQLDRRRQALEEFHDEISQMHHEALELHLSAQELQAELRRSLGSRVGEALRAARERMSRRYHKEAAQLTRQREELESLRLDLANEHAKLTRRYQELRGWIEDQRTGLLSAVGRGSGPVA